MPMLLNIHRVVDTIVSGIFLVATQKNTVLSIIICTESTASQFAV